jgi:hypothetical protein
VTDDEKCPFERAFAAARRAGRVRWEEQSRIGDQIELLLYEAEERETVDFLVRLARYIFDPVKP